MNETCECGLVAADDECQIPCGKPSNVLHGIYRDGRDWAWACLCGERFPDEMVRAFKHAQDEEAKRISAITGGCGRCMACRAMRAMSSYDGHAIWQRAETMHPCHDGDEFRYADGSTAKILNDDEGTVIVQCQIGA